MTHPRTQYLEEAQDPARQPLLRHDASQQEEAATQSVAEQSDNGGKAAKADAPSAPPLGNSSAPVTQSSSISAQDAVVATYGLPAGYQAQYAEGPPQSAATQPVAQSMTQTPQQSWRMQNFGTFDDEPAIITCAQCGRTGQTFTYKESGCCVWFSALTCIFLGCWPCAWLPFCVHSCKDTLHRCSNCGAIVGKHAWGR